MVIVKFPDSSDWSINNAAFRQLLARFAITFPDDSAGRQQLEMMMAMGGCFLKPGEARNPHVIELMQKVAERTLKDLREGNDPFVSQPEEAEDVRNVYTDLLHLARRARDQCR